MTKTADLLKQLKGRCLIGTNVWAKSHDCLTIEQIVQIVQEETLRKLLDKFTIIEDELEEDGRGYRPHYRGIAETFLEELLTPKSPKHEEGKQNE